MTIPETWIILKRSKHRDGPFLLNDHNTNRSDSIHCQGRHPPRLPTFGEVARIFVEPDGRRADVVLADVHGIKRTLHSYTEKPLRVRGKFIVIMNYSC